MVQSVIDVDERVDRVINIVKAKFGLKNKSEAVTMITNSYEQYELEPELRPEFVAEVRESEKEKGIPFKNIQELRRIVERA
ncbi:DUF2683 domain-containing protein [Candidatus Pacearchaeota archaeon]|nr:DUF2683 domain-containing protein [Candidatus Pacearchaeota archaeon]